MIVVAAVRNCFVSRLAALPCLTYHCFTAFTASHQSAQQVRVPCAESSGHKLVLFHFSHSLIVRFLVNNSRNTALNLNYLGRVFVFVVVTPAETVLV